MYKDSKLIPTKLPQSNNSNCLIQMRSALRNNWFFYFIYFLLEISNEAGVYSVIRQTTSSQSHMFYSSYYWSGYHKMFGISKHILPGENVSFDWRINRFKGVPFCGAQYPEGPLAPKIDIIFTAVHVWSYAHKHGSTTMHTHTHTHIKLVSTSIYNELCRHSGQAVLCRLFPVGSSDAHQPSRNNWAENPARNYEKWHLLMREVKRKDCIQGQTQQGKTSFCWLFCHAIISF